jgi:nucleoside-diphosphate kinase
LKQGDVIHVQNCPILGQNTKYIFVKITGQGEILALKSMVISRTLFYQRHNSLLLSGVFRDDGSFRGWLKPLGTNKTEDDNDAKQPEESTSLADYDLADGDLIPVNYHLGALEMGQVYQVTVYPTHIGFRGLINGDECGGAISLDSEDYSYPVFGMKVYREDKRLKPRAIFAKKVPVAPGSEDTSVSTLLQTSPERTLVILKPDAYRRGLVGSVIAMLEEKGFIISYMRLLPDPPMEKVKLHYHEHEGKDFFLPNCEFVASGPILVMTVDGHNAVSGVRNLVGKIDLPHTIRGKYAHSIQQNIVHASDSLESANYEMSIWCDPQVQQNTIIRRN